MFRILALDLATTTGWALHEQGMQRPFFSAIRLPGKAHEIGRRAVALEAFIREKNKLYGPLTDIVFEQQHVSGRMHMSTIRMLCGLAAIAEKVAYEISCRCFEVSLQEWRKHFLGRGGGFKRGPDGAYLPGQDPKEMAIDKCAEFGWHTDIADAAEACGILDHYMHFLQKADRRCLIPWRDGAFFGGALRAAPK